MTAPIVVGMDLSPASKVALEEAMSIARHRGADIVLAHATQMPSERAGQYSWLGMETVEAYRVALEAALETTRKLLGDTLGRYSGQGVTLSTSFVTGDAERAIAKVAEVSKAQLVVVGSHSRTGFDRLLIGSVAERVSRFTDRDVLVARTGRPKGDYMRVLVPIDFSSTSRRAFEVAMDLSASGGHVTLLHCIQVPPAAAGFVTEDVLREMKAASLTEASRWADEAKRIGINVETVVTSGRPASQIREHAANQDLVVMGSHGPRGFKRFFLGSVAEKTIRHAPCSVYIVRARQQDSGGDDQDGEAK